MHRPPRRARARSSDGSRPIERAAVAVVAVLLVLSGCGSEPEGTSGTASLWITRDRGREVLLTTTVPAGLTAMQALDRKADVETRYGGRYVHSIAGLEGDLRARRDWFYFINGIEPDLSAADYRLRDGDVEWWDYRSWRGQMREPVVVGAFPEPFVHGFAGKTRPVAVRYGRGLERGARAIGKLLRATSVAPATATAPPDAHVFLTVKGRVSFRASLRDASGGPGSPVRFVFSGDAKALARDPRRYRFRYEVRP